MSEESTPNQFTDLPEDAVISLEQAWFSIVGKQFTKTFLVWEATESIAAMITFPSLRDNLKPEARKAWIEDGVSADVLIPGQGWKKGLVRISIEFCPDQPEPEADEPEPQNPDPEDSTTEDPGSLLDDIRQTLINPHD